MLFCFLFVDISTRLRPSILAFLFLALSSLAGCSGGSDEAETVRFAVIADPHLYDTDLGLEGKTLKARSAAEIKMIAQGEAVLQEAINRLLETVPQPDFLLIPGDLTVDGEEPGHRKMAAYLYALTDAGVDVWVVPGNHDISNPHAFADTRAGPVSIYSPDAEEFAGIYRDFGYGQAIDRDPHSLSYVAEPAPGLWLFAIDSNRYRENETEPIVGGRIAPPTMEWLLFNLQLAREKNKRVIAMMHHGMVEHLIGQGDFMPDYLIEDWDATGYELAAAGMNVIFTGHYHTQNVTRRNWDDGVSLVEIQTGSLITYPVPFRLVDLDMGDPDAGPMQMDIQSRFIDTLPAGSYPDDYYCCFYDYARTFAENLLQVQAKEELQQRYNMPPIRAGQYAPMLAEAVLAHYAGDESPSFFTLLQAISLANSSDPVLAEIGLILSSLYNDLEPADNDLSLQIDSP